MSVAILGLGKVLGYFRGLATSMQNADETVVLVGSALKYARPVETGIRAGRRWRRAGPARMLGRALDEELPRIEHDVRAAINQDSPLRPVLLAAGHRVQARAQRYTPVITGTLRRSMHTVEVRR